MKVVRRFRDWRDATGYDIWDVVLLPLTLIAAAALRKKRQK
jgi:hypothetical protein